MPLLSSSTKRNNLSPAFNTTRLGRELAAIVRQRVPPMFHVTSKQARCQCCRTNSCLADVAWSSSPHLSGEMPGRAAQRVKRPRTVAVAGVVHGELDIPLRRQGQELVFDLHLQCARPGHRARISRRGIAVFPSTTTREGLSSLRLSQGNAPPPFSSWISTCSVDDRTVPGSRKTMSQLTTAMRHRPHCGPHCETALPAV